MLPRLATLSGMIVLVLKWIARSTPSAIRS